MVALAVEGLAIIAQEEGRYRVAVELWGFSDELRSIWVIPLTDERIRERDRYLEEAERALGRDVVEDALAAGRLLSLPDALARFRASR